MGVELNGSPAAEAYRVLERRERLPVKEREGGVAVAFHRDRIVPRGEPSNDP